MADNARVFTKIYLPLMSTPSCDRSFIFNNCQNNTANNTYIKRHLQKVVILFENADLDQSVLDLRFI